MWRSKKTPRRERLLRAGRALIAAGALAVLGAVPAAQAQSATCRDLRAQIARAASGGEAARYRAAAGKQHSEINRTAAYAHSLGCDREQFLFFGDPPPARCGSINARLSQMRANLAALERQGWDDSARRELQYRYDSECGGQATASPGRRPRNFFEELFGVAPPENGSARVVPVEPPGDEAPSAEFADDGIDEKPRGGSMAICVRSCDGGFFPVSYSARESNLGDLEELCKALCPNAEAALYTRSQWKNLDEAVSIGGSSYADHPNAFKFQKTYDASCSCKPPGRNWAEALEDAERILAAAHSKDVVVSPEEAEKMSRPAAVSERGKDRPAAANPPAAPEPVASTEKPPAQEVFREVTGPDGVKRRVRVVAPTL